MTIKSLQSKMRPSTKVVSMLGFITSGVLILLPLFVALGGCQQQGSKVNVPPSSIPDGLKDCNFYAVNVQGHRLYVTRCGNSTSTTSAGE